MKHPAFFRWPVVGLTLATILYFALMTATAPALPFETQILPTGELKVFAPITPGVHVRPDDIILSVDGWPTDHYVDWHRLFDGLGPKALKIKRDDAMTTATVVLTAPSIEQMLDRLMPHLAAIATAAFGALILMLALPDNRAAWRAGYVFLGMGVVVAAFGSLLRAPGSRAGFELLVPIIGVAFAELAGLDDVDPSTPGQRLAQGLLYSLALLLTLAGALDIFVLSPQGLSVYALTGLPLLRLQVFWGAACLLLNPIMVLWRFGRTPPSLARQRFRLLLVGTGLAVSPLFGLVLLRTFELIPPIENWEWTVLSLTLIAATYGYVIYRHHYLGLDIVATRALTLLVLGLLVAVVFALSVTLMGQSLALVAVFGLAVLAPMAHDWITRGMRWLLYGRSVSAVSLPAIVGRLSAAPQAETIRAAFREALAGMQVARGVLLLSDAKGDLEVADALHLSEDDLETSRSLYADASHSQVTRVQARAGTEDWCRVVAPVWSQGRWSGWMLLGPRIPDDVYNDFQLAFAQQVATAIGLANQAAQLFEASRELSRQILQVREAERFQLAAQLHDEPLQKISAAANSLELLSLRASERLSPETHAELDRNQRLLREVTAELRDICAGLRPPALEAGLPLVIQRIEQRLKDERLDVHTEVSLAGSEVAEPVTAAVYHILTEAANNIIRHAHARRAWIRVGQCEGRLVCVAEDDGVGLNVPALNVNDLIRSRHFGLVGMHDWAATIGATLTIEPRPGGAGTRVQLACYTASPC